MIRILFIILILSYTTQASAIKHWPQWNQLANAHYLNKQFDSAYTYYFNLAHQTNQENVPDSVVAESYRKLGIILYQQEQYQKSIEDFKLAGEHYSRIKDQKNTQKCWSNLANIYVKLEKYELAEGLYQKRLRQAINNSDRTAQLSTHINIGGLYNYTKQYDLAIEHLYLGQSLAIELRDTMRIKLILNNLSTIYLNQEMPDSALLYLRNSATLSNDLRLKKAALKNLYEMHRQLGNIDSIIPYVNQYHAVSDSLKNDKIALTIANLEAELQLEKSRANFATALNWALGLAVILIVGLVFWVLDKRYTKKRLKEFKGLTNMFIQQLKAFENEKSEVGSALHARILPTLVSVVQLIKMGEIELGQQHLIEIKDELYKIYSNQFYSRRFTDSDWLIYTPTNAKYNSEWIDIQCDHDPGMYTNEFQIAVLSILEQLLQDGQQKLFVVPDEYGIEVSYSTPITFSYNTQALLSFFGCRVQKTRLHIPLLENRL